MSLVDLCVGLDRNRCVALSPHVVYAVQNSPQQEHSITICNTTGTPGFKPSSKAQAGDASSSSQCRVLILKGRVVDITAGDPTSSNSFAPNVHRGIDNFIVTADDLRFLCFLEALMSRAQSVETRNENMESVVEVEIHVGLRRRFSISPSLLTTLTGAASGPTVVSQSV